MSTLADVLARGQGNERPFRCEAHDDNQASASVNVTLGVWYCYACHASGKVDTKSKKALALADLQAMINPEVAVRTYAEAYLELFDNDLGNWAKRFPRWIRWHASFGSDPITGDATFPVRTPNGILAGVGRRVESPAAGESRFRYPPRWSASRSMFFAGLHDEVLCITEGASDTVANAEAGCFSAACYGSGVHAPQIELIARHHPKLVLLGLDADDAGQRGTYGFTDNKGKKMPGAKEILERSYEVAVIDWAFEHAKDSASLPVAVRADLIARTVAGTRYGANKSSFAAMQAINATRLQADYATQEE